MNLNRLSAAGSFAEKADEPNADVTITLPDDLSTLSDADLTALRDQVVEAFNVLKAEPVTPQSIETLTALRDAKVVLDGELNVRVETATAAAAAIAALDAEVNGGAVAEADDTAGDMAAGAPDGLADVGAPANAVPAATVVKAASTISDAAGTLLDAAQGAPAASPAAPAGPPAGAAAKTGTLAKAMPKTINVGNLAARTNVRAAIGTPVAGAERNLFSAAVNVPGLVPGESLTLDKVSTALDNAMRNASNGAVRAAMNAGQRFSQRYPIATLNKPMSGSPFVNERDEFSAEHPAYKYAVDQSRLPGGSLVAAGGWCAPSETVYDLCSLESTDGLLSIPEINVARGGIRFTQGPDWASIFESTGFCFTEADDIAGIYSGNEIQTISVPTTVTTWHISFNGATGTVGALPVGASAAQVSNYLENLKTAGGVSVIGPENVFVTTPNAAANPAVYTVEFVNALGGTNVPAQTATVDTGTGTITVTTTTAGDAVVSGKPCDTIPCPPFTDVRLNVCGVCITGANLQNVAYPELTQRYLRGALTGHAHRLNTQIIASMILQSTPVANLANTADNSATAPILQAIEYQVEDMKYRQRMSRNQAFEAVFPFWVRGLIRADMARRSARDDADASFNITDAQINGWFAARGINAQFVYDWQNLGAASAGVGAYPAQVSFLVYPAGTFVKGTQDIISLEMLHDSTLNATNNFTAIFTEEAWSVMKMCSDSRVVTVNACPTGTTGLGAAIGC